MLPACLRMPLSRLTAPLPYVMPARPASRIHGLDIRNQLHCTCTVHALKVHYPCMGNGSYSRWNTCMEINAFCISLAACPVLLLAAVAFLTYITIGVRKGDLSDPSPA